MPDARADAGADSRAIGCSHGSPHICPHSFADSSSNGCSESCADSRAFSCTNDDAHGRTHCFTYPSAYFRSCGLRCARVVEFLAVLAGVWWRDDVAPPGNRPGGSWRHVRNQRDIRRGRVQHACMSGRLRTRRLVGLGRLLRGVRRRNEDTEPYCGKSSRSRGRGMRNHGRAFPVQRFPVSDTGTHPGADGCTDSFPFGSTNGWADCSTNFSAVASADARTHRFPSCDRGFSEGCSGCSHGSHDAYGNRSASE